LEQKIALVNYRISHEHQLKATRSPINYKIMNRASIKRREGVILHLKRQKHLREESASRACNLIIYDDNPPRVAKSNRSSRANSLGRHNNNDNPSIITQLLIGKVILCA